MAFKDKLQELLQKVTANREGDQPQPMSNRPNGGVSGYQPKLHKRKPVQEGPEEHPAAAFGAMAPRGVNPQMMPPYQQNPQMNTVPQQQVQPQPGVPQARYNGPQQPQQANHTFRFQHGAPQPAQPQQPQQTVPPQAAWQQGYTYQQPVVQPNAQPQQGAARPQVQQPSQPQQPVQPQQAESNLRYFPGSFVGEGGSAYKMVLRVAQITGVPSCYRLIEFMQNSEAMIVNAEQIADVMEANRCMDLLFGAAYAMNQNFVRISGKMIYLVAPRTMQVLPFDSMLYMSQADAERRWPGANRASQQEQRWDNDMTAHYRPEDFAPAYGQRAAGRSAQAGAYTDYGGYSAGR